MLHKGPRPLRVLYVDDDMDNLETFRLCCDERWKIVTLQEGRPIFTGGISIDDFDVLLLDLVLAPSAQDFQRAPDTSGGLKILSWVQAHKPRTPVLIVTGVMDMGLKMRLENIGPWIRYFEKPISFGEKGFMEMVEEFVDAHSRISAS